MSLCVLTVPICIDLSGGCSALLNINATYLCRRVRRRDKNSGGTNPQPHHSNHKNSFVFFFFPAVGVDPKKPLSCVDMVSPELYNQQSYHSLPHS